MRKQSRIKTTALLLGMVVLTSLNVCRAQQAPAAAPSASAGLADAAIEPDAVAALNRMGAYLRTLTAFSVRADTTTDEVTDDGMKLQFVGAVTIQMQRPNHLRIDVSSDRKQRQVIFDGKTVTLFGPRIGYYSTVSAPGTIRELLDAAQEKYDLNLPLTDLFRWGSDDTSLAAVNEAAVIGPSHIGGVLCDHIAVRQADVDWQVWIERGKSPLPRKLVITTKGEEGQPQFAATMQWNLAPKFGTATFRFVPPKNAHQIPLVSADAASTGK
jgi:hypothetical protein